MPLPIQIVAL